MLDMSQCRKSDKGEGNGTLVDSPSYEMGTYCLVPEHRSRSARSARAARSARLAHEGIWKMIRFP